MGMTHQTNAVLTGTTGPFFDPYRVGRPAELAKQVAAEILAGPHLSVLATTNADGSPQMAVIFVKPDGDDILFSTLKGRRKTVNILRDPRVNLLVHSLPVGDAASTYAAISGTVELTDDPDGSFHQVLYDLHMGGATPPPEPGAQRLVVRLKPTRIYAPPNYSSALEQ
jgi:PPOX class probable F420-dependent enzyme